LEPENGGNHSNINFFPFFLLGEGNNAGLKGKLRPGSLVLSLLLLLYDSFPEYIGWCFLKVLQSHRRPLMTLYQDIDIRVTFVTPISSYT
jgi:hypothetical protein